MRVAILFGLLVGCGGGASHLWMQGTTQERGEVVAHRALECFGLTKGDCRPLHRLAARPGPN